MTRWRDNGRMARVVRASDRTDISLFPPPKATGEIEWIRDISAAPRDGTPLLIEYEADGQSVPSGVAVVVWADRSYRGGAFREPTGTHGDIDVCLWWPESHVTGWIPIPT